MKRPQRICAPSRAIIRRNNVLTRNAADLKQRFAGIDVETAPMSAGELSQIVRNEAQRWSRIIKATGAKPE